MGAAFSTTYGGYLIEHFGYNVSFLGLSGVGLVALTLLFDFFPETGSESNLTILHKEQLAINEAD